MCGGRVLIHPCSHVGHVLKIWGEYSSQESWKNAARTAKLWLNEKYTKIFRLRLPWSYRYVSYLFLL